MNKKHLIYFLVVVSCFWNAVSWAAASGYGPKAKRFGVGIMAGEPTGLALKGYVTSQLAIDGIVSWSFVDEALTLVGDAIYDFFDIEVHSKKVTLPFYAGAGAKIAFKAKRRNQSDATTGGIRIPVGLACQWSGYPIEAFIELGPGIQLGPETKFDITGGIGARFYFF